MPICRSRFFRGFQQCDSICHSLAFADPDVCGGAGKGRVAGGEDFDTYVGSGHFLGLKF